MARRRTRNYREERVYDEDSDLLEEDEDLEEDSADEEEDEESEAEEIAKKKKVKEPKTKRTRTTKHVRMKVVWVVFDNSNKKIQTFPYKQKQEAEELAARLQTEKKSTHFIQPVKEPIEDK